MHRIVRIVRSVITAALLAPILATGCGSDPGSIALSGRGHATPTAPTARPDIVVPASAATAGATAISSWVIHALPDGGQQVRGTGPHGVRIQIESPHYTSRTAGSLTLSVFDDAGHETQGFLTIIDGNVIDRSLPAGAGDLAQRLHDDLAQAPDFYNWNDCSAAQQNEAAASAAVVVAGAAVVVAGVAVAAACFTPAVVVVADCLAATAAASAAAAALAAANATEAQASSAMHAACDNLCTSDSWCTGRYGSGWSCNSEGSCEQVISTVCFPCQTVGCGWDFTCVTANNPAPTWCGDCGGGGGGGSCDQQECEDECGGTALCSGDTCLCGT
jgi:hypothetical protein